MNFKRYHVSKNLFDKSKRTDNSRVVDTTGEIGELPSVFASDFTPIEPNTTYTLNIVSSISSKTGHLFALYDENKNFVNTGAHEALSATVYTFTTPSNVAYIRFNGNMASVDGIMLNSGSIPLPYEPYGNTWLDSHYIKGTDTDTITTLPATIYPLAQNVTVGLKGNAVQSGTPTPSNPVDVQGTGDKTANLFDINNSFSSVITVTNNVATGTSYDFLIQNIKTPATLNGQVCTFTAHLKRLTEVSPRTAWVRVKDGDTVISGNTITTEGTSTVTFTASDTTYLSFEYNVADTLQMEVSEVMLNLGSTALPYEPYGYKIPISINNVVTDIYIGDNPLRKSLDGTAYDTLAADGTLTRRVDSDGSVLPTPIVTQVTMPTFTTTPGDNTLNVLTTVPPSEVTATFNGWHPVTAAHERENGAWTE